MEAEELASILAHTTQLPHDFAVLTVEKPHMAVADIRNVQIALLLVGGKGYAAGRAAVARSFGERELLYKLAFFGGHLDAVGLAIGRIDQSIIGDVEREVATEFFWQRSFGNIRAICRIGAHL